jgi:hypothetical protein
VPDRETRERDARTTSAPPSQRPKTTVSDADCGAPASEPKGPPDRDKDVITELFDQGVANAHAKPNCEPKEPADPSGSEDKESDRSSAAPAVRAAHARATNDITSEGDPSSVYLAQSDHNIDPSEREASEDEPEAREDKPEQEPPTATAPHNEVPLGTTHSKSESPANEAATSQSSGGAPAKEAPVAEEPPAALKASDEAHKALRWHVNTHHIATVAEVIGHPKTLFLHIMKAEDHDKPLDQVALIDDQEYAWQRNAAAVRVPKRDAEGKEDDSDTRRDLAEAVSRMNSGEYDTLVIPKRVQDVAFNKYPNTFGALVRELSTNAHGPPSFCSESACCGRGKNLRRRRRARAPVRRSPSARAAACLVPRCWSHLCTTL